MLDFRFLTEEQVFGNKKLDIFKKNSELIFSPITDFSILLGGDSSLSKQMFSVEKDDYFVGKWWCDTVPAGFHLRTVTRYGDKDINNACSRHSGARPVIKYSQISNMIKSKKVRSDGILEVEFGEYPQYVVDIGLEYLLEQAWDNRRMKSGLKATGKSYSFDSVV